MNSVVAFHSLRIKRYIVRLMLVALLIAILVFILKEAIKHLTWIELGKLDLDYNIAPLLYTAIFIDAALIAGILALFIVLVIYITISFRMLKHYKNTSISNIQRVQLPFDYKLWQTAPKNTFHAMTLTLKIDGEEQSFLSDIIFTNNRKIGLFKVPDILCSQSYVKEFCTLGFDEKRNKAIVVSVEK